MNDEPPDQFTSRPRKNPVTLSPDEAVQTANLLQLLLEQANANAPATATGGSAEVAPRTTGKAGRLRMLARDVFLRRSARNRFIEAPVFGEPAWDMLLALYVAELTGAKYTVTQVSSYSGTPATTALRWLDHLEKQQYVSRSRSSKDGRCIFVELSDKARAELDAYFEKLDKESESGPQ